VNVNGGLSAVTLVVEDLAGTKQFYMDVASCLEPALFHR
jgi:hypothetical protein